MTKPMTLRDAGNIGRLELSPAPQPDYFIATLLLANLEASLQVYAYAPFGGLESLLRELASAWRGWAGSRDWKSIEGDLQLSFKHDGVGHINVGIGLRSLNPRWKVETQIVLEPGALADLAQDAERFFASIKTSA